MKLTILSFCIPVLGLMVCANRAEASRLEPVAIDASWIELWSADLDSVEAILPRTHPNLFHKRSASSFHSDLGTLRGNLPEMSQHEVVVALSEIVASVGDGHTRLTLPIDPGAGFFLGHSKTKPALIPGTPFHHYPIRLYDFADGLFVTRIGREHAALVGSELIAIDGHPIDEVKERVGSVVEHDNALQTRHHLPERMVVPEVLHALGVVDQLATGAFTFRTTNGTDLVVNLSPVEIGKEVDWVDARIEGDSALYLRDIESNYWFEYIPESRTVFFQYNTCYDRDDESIPAFADRLFRFIDENPVDQLIIDMRHNRGGDNSRNQPFLHGIIRADKLQSRGSLYAIVGRTTFSAAMSFTVELEQHTSVIFAGEPTGSSPNHYGDSRKTVLENSGITIRTSTLYWQQSNPKDHRDAIYPQIPVDLASVDYMGNVDPVLDEVGRFASDGRASPSGDALSDPTGEWRGSITVGYERVPTVLRIDRDDTAFRASIDLPDEGLMNVELEEVQYDGPTLRFVLVVGDLRIPFEGRISGDRFIGDATLYGRDRLVVLERSP